MSVSVIKPLISLNNITEVSGEKQIGNHSTIYNTIDLGKMEHYVASWPLESMELSCLKDTINCLKIC